MYLQITSKCNMTCVHCCYSCNKNGKHMDYEDVRQAIYLASEYSEMITIGGGEPTLHPRFFDILKLCLNTFDYVWMATNGSQTKKMFRLANIIEGEDWPEDGNEEDWYNYNSINGNGKLVVALSQDYYHSPIDERVVRLWKGRKGRGGFEIRNVSGKVIKAGRAARNNEYQEEKGCVCPDIIIHADGRIKACGCKKSPEIGTLRIGITEKIWKKLHNNVKFQDTNCAGNIRIK